MVKRSLKLFVSVLLVATLMLSTVMAAPTPPPAGMYIGGTVLKFYTISQFMDSKTKVAEVQTAKLWNVKYSDGKGKIAALNAIAAGTPLNEALKSVTTTDLTDTYKKVDGSTFVPNPPQAAGPTVSNVSIEGVDHTGKVDATVANNKISFTVDPNFFYTTGGLTLSDDAVTVTGTVNGVAINQTVDKSSDFVALIKTALGVQVNQIKGSTLLNLNGTQLTLTKGTASTVYTIEVKDSTVTNDFEVIDIY